MVSMLLKIFHGYITRMISRSLYGHATKSETIFFFITVVWRIYFSNKITHFWAAFREKNSTLMGGPATLFHATVGWLHWNLWPLEWTAVKIFRVQYTSVVRFFSHTVAAFSLSARRAPKPKQGVPSREGWRGERSEVIRMHHDLEHFHFFFSPNGAFFSVIAGTWWFRLRCVLVS